MKYVDEMDSGALIYIPSFIKISSGIQKLLGGIHMQAHREQGGLINLFLILSLFSYFEKIE
jgi:hypothetical protein